MEFVNEDIGIEILRISDIKNSYCTVTRSDTHLSFDFGLYTNDCLFDLSENNYQVFITISHGYFVKYKETFDIVEGSDTICCNIQSKLLDIINISLYGIHRKIFLESNILFLLYQLGQNRNNNKLDCNSCSILSKPIERVKMDEARKFILENLSNTLSIPIIANHVGTNQCYLKKGFKEVFNQTLFEFIQENRMIKAKHLLLNSELSITEISFSVGYASLSSFSQSYKNYYRISPMEQRKAVFS